ncbi:MAG: TonB-dependent receptor [Cyclobacteriaceae bacterium]
MMKHKLFIKSILLFSFLLAIVAGVYGQGNVVSGTISDAVDGSGIPGVNVLEKGTTNGVVSNVSGNFSITVEEGAILILSFVGYVTQEITVGAQTKLDVQMETDVEQLQEVVVIGYGQAKKSDLTGSVVSVSAEDFNKGALTSPQELLMGKVAGVQISAPTGQPGGASTIRIRGGSSLQANNDPLIVIDGVPITNKGIDGFANPLTTINPNDIETFTVLKDASATAIYGARASNGVIIITTKTGQAGQELKVSYNGKISVGVPIKYVPVYTGDEFREVVANQTADPSVATPLLGTENTDWQKLVLDNAVSSDHNISVSGSMGESLPYRATVGYTDQNGMLKRSHMKRTTFGLALNPSLLDDHLKVNVNLKGMLTDNNFSKEGALGEALRFDPTQPVYDENSPFGGFYTWTSPDGTPNFIGTTNPVARIEQSENTSDVFRSIGNLELDYRFHFLPDMKAVLNVGYDRFDSDGTDNTDPLAAFGARSPQINVKTFTYSGGNELLDFYLNYSKALLSIESRIDVTAGYSWQHFHNEKINRNRPWEQTDGVYVGADTTVDKTENYLVSFFGRINYSLKDRYLLTATLRNDGSSRFAEGNQWGLFPSVGFAWKINEEPFLKSSNTINELKLRAGWGVTGQQDIGFNSDYPAIASYNGSTSNAQYLFGNQLYTLWKPEAYDPNIKWEETTTVNVGLDVSLLNDRINASIDYYHRTTNDLLNEVPIPVGTNFASRLITNVGSLENKGIEISLGGYAISQTDLSLYVAANFAKNRNEITKLTAFPDPNYIGYEVGEIDGGSNNRIQINSVGYPANTFFMFQQVYDQDGNPIEGLYVDKTGNGGAVDGNDLNRNYLETPTPDFSMGVSSSLTYKQFDFSFSGRLNVGNYVFNNINANNALYSQLYNQSGYLANIASTVENSQFFNAQYKTDYYLENGSFFRMDNISAGYNIDRLFSDKINARLSFTVQNAFLITKYSGIDPEINDATNPGIDKNIYPRPRTFVLGFNINF